MSASVRFSVVARPHRLAWPRTLPFQGSNTGSNPVGDTIPFNVDQAVEKLTHSGFTLEPIDPLPVSALSPGQNPARQQLLENLPYLICPLQIV